FCFHRKATIQLDGGLAQLHQGLFPNFLLRKLSFKLAVVAILKNEAPYVIEWIAYHRVVGVEHFYLYTNDSTDESDGILKCFARAGIVTLINWPSRPNVNSQKCAYEHALLHFRKCCQWLAIIDCDEMIVPLSANSIVEGLKEFENEAGLAINWNVFGSSGRQIKTIGLVMERFTKCSRKAAINRHVKTLAKTDKIKTPDIHTSTFLSGNLVDVQHGIVKSPIHSHITHEKFQINHYLTKSRAEWEIKRRRGKADFWEGSKEKYRLDSEFEDYDLNEEEDPSILRYLQKTKQEIAELNRVMQEIMFQDINPLDLKIINKNKLGTVLPETKLIGTQGETSWTNDAYVQNGVARFSVANQESGVALEITSNFFQKCTRGLIYKQSAQFSFDSNAIDPQQIKFLYYGKISGFTLVDTKWTRIEEKWWYAESYYYCMLSDEIRLLNVLIPREIEIVNVFLREPEWTTFTSVL
ncbi:MAG: hypothetical protein EOM42_08390, partial [Negativicutes bacterium]|nr:hypothetical protein [Negativicutes bacterium]